VSFFFEDMASLYRQADLAVARAGAGTLAELAVMELPAILVPFPHAADDHQTANALGYIRTGGAIVLKEREMTPQGLAGIFNRYRKASELLVLMRQSLRKQKGEGDPAEAIAKDILNLTGFAPKTVPAEE
jgi:UDP-N-acetylglucosamine--N-acetylmuramyl-(pentapeptide) pyrophosphoryl-undecaprenol N-acetylglucosamine transferase